MYVEDITTNWELKKMGKWIRILYYIAFEYLFLFFIIIFFYEIHNKINIVNEILNFINFKYVN